jgi:hypothetical protein
MKPIIIVSMNVVKINSWDENSIGIVCRNGSDFIALVYDIQWLHPVE